MCKEKIEVGCIETLTIARVYIAKLVGKAKKKGLHTYHTVSWILFCVH